MADRRRIVGPIGTTSPPIFASSLIPSLPIHSKGRSRGPKDLRKLFLRTGLTPSASGSAYLELEAPSHSTEDSFISHGSTLKLTCTVHGPRPLPRSTSFSPNMLLSTHVKFAPFATKQRRGYLRDATERDLAVLLETALRGVLINDRWPKSGVEVIVTVLEGEDDGSLDIYALEHQHQTQDRSTNSAIMTVLSGCITVASAAIIDAGIDCVGVVSGGTAALVKGSPHSSQPSLTTQINGADYHVLLDPSASDNDEIVATCVVGYMKTRDEITEVWITGDVPTQSQANPSSDTLVEFLIEGAARAASATHLVIADLFKDLK